MKKMPCPATGKKVGIIVLREARETGKEKYHVVSLLCGLYNRQDFTYKTNILTIIENILVVV